MALKVPIYNEPQVQAHGLPTPQLSTQTPNLGAAFGAGLHQAAGVAAEFAAKAKETADTQVLLERSNQVREAVNRGLEKLQQTVGDDIRNPQAFGGQQGQTYGDYAQQQIDKVVADAKNGLSPELATRLDQHVSPMVSSYGHTVRTHEYEQIKKIQEDTASAAAVKSEETALLAVDKTGHINEDILNGALADGAIAVQQHSKLVGRGEDANNLATQKYTSGVLMKVIRQVKNMGNSTGAQALLERYGNHFTVEDRAKLSDEVKEVRDENIAFDVSRTALTKFSNKNDQTFDEVAALDYMKGELKDNPVAFKKAEEQLSHLASAQHKSWAASESAVVDRIYAQMSKGASPMTVNRLVDAAVNDGSLGGKSAVAIKQHVHSWQRQLLSEARDDIREKQSTILANFILNPEPLRKMSAEQVLGLVSQVGPHGVMQLAEWKRNMETPSKSDLQIDDNDFRLVAGQFGLMDKAGKPVGKHADFVNQLRSQAEREIEAETGKKKAPLTRAEKIDVLKKLAAPVTLQTGGFLGYGKTEQKPFFMLTSEDVKKDYILKLDRAGVADADKPLMQAYLQQHKFTPEDVLRMKPEDLQGVYKDFVARTKRPKVVAEEPAWDAARSMGRAFDWAKDLSKRGVH